MYVRTPRERTLSVIRTIAVRHGCTAQEILGPCKLRHLVEARWECIALFRKRGMSTSEIGRLMNRDHTTIIHALQKMSMRKPVITIGVAGASAGLI